MKRFMYKKMIQKIVLVILTIISLNIIVYPISQAVSSSELRPEEEEEGVADVLGFAIVGITNTIADAFNRVMQTMVIGNDAAKIVINGGPAVTYMTETKKAPDSNPNNENLPEVRITRDAIKIGVLNYDVATIKLTPAEIFAGNVAALDANFFETDTDYSGKLGGEERSIVSELKSVVAGWYVAIRNIAIVGLLSVLIYLGIRMIITSSVGEKAKYKQLFVDWVIALCLIFFLHYIMSFTMTISEAVTDMFARDSNADGTIDQVIIQLTDTADNNINDRRFYSNLVNVVRIKTQLPSFTSKMGYGILYIMLTGLTAYYVYIYLKRLLMLAFLTLIAPFVSFTYPIDKLKDGHAQAFNFWFKEYVFYAMLQPLHMLLYTIFITSALEIAVNNILYAVVVMACMTQAEKIVKQMFNIHSSTEGNIAGFAGGALAGSLMNRLGRPSKSAQNGGGGGGGNSKPRMARNPNGTSMNAALNSGNVPGGGTGSGGGAGAPATASTNGQTTVGATTTADGRTVYTANPHQGAGTSQYAGAFNNASMPGANASSAGQGTTAGRRYSNVNGQNQHQTFTQRAGSSLKQAIKNGVNRITPQKFKDVANSAKNKINSVKNWAAQTKAGHVARAIKNSALGQAASRRYKLAGGGKGIAKKLAAKAARASAKGVLAGAGILIGAGIGAIGDGPAGMFKGAAAGAAGGLALGGRVANTVGNTASGNNAVGRFLHEVNAGSADEAARARGENDYINDTANLERILQDNPDFTADELRDYARREYNMMYDSKTDDVDNAGKALDLEDAFINDGMDVNEAHTRAAGILNATKTFDKSIFSNDKKLWEAEDAVVSNLMSQGMTQQEAIARTDRTFQDLANLYGMGNQVNIQAKRAARNNSQARNNQPQNNQPQNNQPQNGQQTATRRINTTMNGRGSNRTATTQTVNPSQATTQNIPGPTTTTTTTVNTGGTTTTTTTRTINTTNARRPSTTQTQTTVEQTTSSEPRTINTGASRTGRTTSTNTVVNQTIDAPQTQETRTVNNVQTGASSRNIDVNTSQTVNHQVVSGENTSRTINTTNARRPSTTQTQTTVEQTTIEQTNTTEPRTINTGASRTGRTTSTNTVVNQTIDAPQTQETRTVNNVQTGASSRNIDVNTSQTVNHQVVSGENTSRTINTTNARRPSTTQTQTTVEQTTIEQTNTTEPRTINTGASRTGRTTNANTVVNQTVEAPQTIETRGQTTTQVNNSRRRTIVENQVINDTETVDRGVEQTTTRRKTVQKQTQPQQQTIIEEHTIEKVQEPQQQTTVVKRTTERVQKPQQRTVVENITEKVEEPQQLNKTVEKETKNETVTYRGRKIQRTTTRTTTTTGDISEQVRNKAKIEDDKDSLLDETIRRIKKHTAKKKLARKKRDSNKNE